MTAIDLARNRRVLVVDDTRAIHEDFRKILAADLAAPELADDEALLFDGPADAARARFELVSAFQGCEALDCVRASLLAQQPFAMAFVDMRMPPGWDGAETIEHLWQADPLLQIVICTAFSDYSWDELLARLHVGDRLLVLKKPFDPIEVYQLASTLTAKWQQTRLATAKAADLEATIDARTIALREVNEALVTEISDRKLLECQLVQSGKLASIGQLAAGVAHEINNPIAFVYSNMSSLESYVENLLAIIVAYEAAHPTLDPAVLAELHRVRSRLDLDTVREDLPGLLKETTDGVLRVRQIVRDLRDFSRDAPHQNWQPADLHRGIDSTLNIVAAELKYRADIVKHYGTLPEIQCLPAQLNQVIMNLAMNAAYACGSSGAARGTITVRTGTSEGGEEVWFEVADTGCGIAPEVLPRIFDPFFTTKPVGTGTGLGLSLSYGIVLKHHGRIDLHSVVDQGSTFRVTLPVRQTAPA